MKKVKHKNTNKFFVITLILVTAVCAVVLANGKIGTDASAVTVSDSESDVVSVEVLAACFFNGGNDAYNEYSDTINPGGSTTIVGDDLYASCNDGAGFDVYAVGFSDYWYYGDNTDMIASYGGTNIKTDGSGGASYWKMKLAPSGSTNLVTIDNGYGSFSVIPSDYTKVAHFNSNTTYSAITPSYQVYASTEQEAGTYVGVVKYTIVHPNNATAPTKPIAPPESCNNRIPYLTYLQDVLQINDNPTVDSMVRSLPPNEPYYLYDARDGEPYCVAKLDDGNLWMLDNLRLDIVALTQEELYGTGYNAGRMTNASNTTLGYLKGTTSRDPSIDPDGNYATAGVSDVWTSISQDSYDMPMIKTSNKNTVGLASEQWGNGSHKYGIYYNFCAASAGSYCYSSASVGNATEDVCPAGWRMPSGTPGKGEYWKLCTAIKGSDCDFTGSEVMNPSSPNSLQYELSTPLSGYYSSGDTISGSGSFWASTISNILSMNYLYVDSYNTVNPQDYFLRQRGLSVRCIRNLNK